MLVELGLFPIVSVPRCLQWGKELVPIIRPSNGCIERALAAAREAVSRLLSPRSICLVTGKTLYVDGGYHLMR